MGGGGQRQGDQWGGRVGGAEEEVVSVRVSWAVAVGCRKDMAQVLGGQEGEAPEQHEGSPVSKKEIGAGPDLGESSTLSPFLHVTSLSARGGGVW